jgi:hypothetical protein
MYTQQIEVSYKRNVHMLVPVRILFLISASSVFHLSDRNWYILSHNADNVYILKD